MLAAKPIIAGIYATQRHPKYELEMKPPMNGAIKGPQMIMAPNSATARPRYLLLYMSANTAPQIAKGALPKKPPYTLSQPCLCKFARRICFRVTEIANVMLSHRRFRGHSKGTAKSSEETAQPERDHASFTTTEGIAMCL